jgi:predicted AlkP superfamily pyrophosphatase or phosphodiesterase
LVREGYNFTNNHFNYFPTYTGPGHAAIYTGATPSVNGIVGNSWYDRSRGENMYVVQDGNVAPVGIKGSAGKMSPKNITSTTIADEIKSADKSAKVFAVALKDRGAITASGHLGDGAYWFDSENGKFITSSWYQEELPEWVEQFNESGIVDQLSSKTWETLLNQEEYTKGNPDNTPYEAAYDHEDAPVFPHENPEKSYGMMIATPFGNTLTKDFAKKMISVEQIGSDPITDFVGISFSSTDYVGHQFGPRSVELHDTYLRLDRDIADLLSYLDEQVGEGDYLVFLSSDHGVVDVPNELIDRNLPGGYFDSKTAVSKLSEHLSDTYGDEEWVESYANQQVYLDRDLVEESEYSIQEIQKEAAQFLLQFEGVQSTNTASNFLSENYSQGLQAMYQRGFNYDRSGDVYIQLKSGWLDSSYETGTSHGSPYNYDTHVPLIFYGWNIPQGSSSQKTVIPQIAPTISNLLDISFPSGSEAEVLKFQN